MTVIIADEAETRGFVRASLVANLISAAEWAAKDLGATLPSGLSFQLPVPDGLDRAAKVAWVEEVAASWGVEPFTEDGTRKAVKRFGVPGLGDVKFTASAALEDLGTTEWERRQDARRAREAAAQGSGSAA